MKAKKIIKSIIVCAGVFLFCIHPSSAQAQEEYREPFANSREEVFDKTLPSEATTSGGQLLKAPPGQGGNPLGVEVPIEDASWVLLVAAILYGVVRRKKINKEEFENEEESE